MGIFKVMRCADKLLKISPKRIVFVNNYGSALFVPGSKATEVCSVVTPHVDASERLRDLQTLGDNLRKRKCQVDVEKLKEEWDFFSSLTKSKEDLEIRRVEIADKLKKLMKIDTQGAKDEVNKLQIHAKIMRDDVKELKSSIWSLEEKAVLQALSLPNVLHKNTPDFEEYEIITFKETPPASNAKTHIDIATECGLLSFKSPLSYYLKGIAAVFELSAKFYFSDRLRTAGFIQFSNPDFAKSVIVEGCGLDHTDPDSVFILHHDEDTKVSDDSRMHLTGGGSLMAFAAYYTRNVLYPTALPLRYYSLGRQYKPVPEDSSLGLFRVSQSSVSEVFIAVKDSTKELDSELQKLMQTVIDIYKEIGYHFRVCYVPALSLRRWESLRISFQMFSTSSKKYIEVGNISVSDNYIPKRLQFCYKEEKSLFFPKLISGTVLSVPKLLGCILEQNQEAPFEIPGVMKNAL